MPIADMLQTSRVSLIISKNCTLKCKLCGTLSPYVKSYNPTIDYLKEEINAFFHIVGGTRILDISGGEPFLRGTAADFALGEILLYIAKYHKNKFEQLRIFTNGTVLPSDEMCSVFNQISLENNFTIIIDNYGKYSCNVNEIVEKFEVFKINYSVRDYINDIHCGGWVDLRDIRCKNNEQIAKKLFYGCAIPQKLGCCLELMDGIISPCSVVAARYLCKKAEKEDDDIIDLFADPIKMRVKLNKILSAEYFPSCFYCNGGMADDSQRYIPAQQATSTEIEEWQANYSMRF